MGAVSPQLQLDLTNPPEKRQKKRYGITFDIDPTLKRLWKTECALQDISMPDGLCQALELWIKTKETEREAQRKKDEEALRALEQLDRDSKEAAA